MIKETQITQRSTVCDLCGITQPNMVGALNSMTYTSNYAHFFRLHDKDLCDLCHQAVIHTLVKDRVITEEAVETAIEETIPPTRMNVQPCATLGSDLKW